jgi:hypothetical protein
MTHPADSEVEVVRAPQAEPPPAADARAGPAGAPATIPDWPVRPDPNPFLTALLRALSAWCV